MIEKSTSETSTALVIIYVLHGIDIYGRTSSWEEFQNL